VVVIAHKVGAQTVGVVQRPLLFLRRLGVPSTTGIKRTVFVSSMLKALQTPTQYIMAEEVAAMTLDSFR
jgi:hypothetical protein